MTFHVANWMRGSQTYKNADLYFVHPIFRFWLLVTFGDEVTKIQKYYVIFVYILQGKMGKTEKNGKKITQLKWPKYQKPRGENMEWTKYWTKRSSFVIQFTMGNLFGNPFSCFWVEIKNFCYWNSCPGPSNQLVPQIRQHPNSCHYPLIN